MPLRAEQLKLPLVIDAANTGDLWRARYELLREAFALGRVTRDQLAQGLHSLGFTGEVLAREVEDITKNYV